MFDIDMDGWWEACKENVSDYGRSYVYDDAVGPYVTNKVYKQPASRMITTEPASTQQGEHRNFKGFIF